MYIGEDILYRNGHKTENIKESIGGNREREKLSTERERERHRYKAQRETERIETDKLVQ